MQTNRPLTRESRSHKCSNSLLKYGGHPDRHNMPDNVVFNHVWALVELCAVVLSVAGYLID